MTTRGLLIITGLFLGTFLVLFLGKCGYGKLEVYQSIDSLVAHVRQEFPEVAPIDGATLRLYRQQEPPPALIDIRARPAYAMSHLPGAVSLNSAEAILEYLEKADEKVETVLLYGSVGSRSAEIALEVSKASSVRVFHLEGGIFRWANEGGELVSFSGEPAQKVYPFNQVLGRLLDEERRGEIEGEP